MVSEQTRELVRRGEEIYQTRLRATLEAAHMNRYVAIEPDSGEHFLGDTLSEAMQAGRRAHPGKLMYGARVGHPAAVHMGALST